MRERMVVGQEKVKARELHRYILRSIHERQLGPSTLIYMELRTYTNTWVLATPYKSNRLGSKAQASIFHKQRHANQGLGLGTRVPVPHPL